MEFEFRKDFISEQATVKISMGHEAFATWLEQEGQSLNWVDALLLKLSALQQRQISEYKLTGSEFILLLTQDEALVINHSLLNDHDDVDLEGDLHFYDAEIEAACGLEDFLALIESWQSFLKD
ncbi:YacL family protein [Psychromonas sp. MME2]|uniref:YacL family protein n=1 Tax=unclassified Psychromonas TaxID=2614957 RepID=UPI00339C1343